VSTAFLKAARYILVLPRTRREYDCNSKALGSAWASTRQKMSGHPESNQGPSDRCKVLQPDAVCCAVAMLSMFPDLYLLGHHNLHCKVLADHQFD
jgi:hypothetical protein